MHNVSVNYCITCRDRGIKKEIIVNQYSPSDICNDCKPKSIDAKSVMVGNEQVPYDDLISSTLTGWGDKTIQMHYIDKKILSLDAIALIKELSLICGVNARKYSKDESWKDYDNRVKMSGDNPTGENDTKSVFNTDNAISKEFEYLQKLIQDFAVKHEIEIKK